MTTEPPKVIYNSNMFSLWICKLKYIILSSDYSFSTKQPVAWKPKASHPTEDPTGINFKLILRLMQKIAVDSNDSNRESLGMKI